MRVEWRRDEQSPVPDNADDAGLIESILLEIQARGPLTFARFMERALYDEHGGYYATNVARPTRSGDFLTAPEMHPIFGQTLSLPVEEIWQRLGRPYPFVVREHGAGSGALMLALLDGLARRASDLLSAIRYQPVDLPGQLSLINERFAAAGHAGVVDATTRGAMVGIVLANEFLDALPVHRVIVMNGRLREIYVDQRGGRLTEVAGPLTDERLMTWFVDAGIELGEGQRAEVNLAMLDWLAEQAADLRCGALMVIDYGAGARELYGPQRMNGTIRAFAAQHVSSDVLSGVGRRDITASVNFDALERHGRGVGLMVAGRRHSNELLIAAGLDDVYTLVRMEVELDWDQTTLLRSAVARLLDPRALGGYLVSVMTRDVPTDPPLQAFAALDP